MIVHPESDGLSSSSSNVSLRIPSTINSNKKRLIVPPSPPKILRCYAFGVMITCVSFVASFVIHSYSDSLSDTFALVEQSRLLIILILGIFSWMLMASGFLLQWFNYSFMPPVFQKSECSGIVLKLSNHVSDWLSTVVVYIYFIVASLYLVGVAEFRIVLWVVITGYMLQFSAFSSFLIRCQSMRAEASLLQDFFGQFIRKYNIYQRTNILSTLSVAGQLCVQVYLTVNTTDFVDNNASSTLTSAYYAAIVIFGTAIVLSIFSFLLTLRNFLLSSIESDSVDFQWPLDCRLIPLLVVDELLLLIFGPEHLVTAMETYLICKAALWIALSLIWLTTNISFLREHILGIELELGSKNTFIGYLSHEIRNPIATTILGIDVLLNSMHGNTCEMDKKAVIDVLEDLRSSCEVANATLSDVLMFDKIRNNLFALELAPQKALKFAMKAIKPFRLQASAANIELQCVFRGTDLRYVRVDMDQHKMTQVMRNLLSNALKFTKSGGHITVQISTKKTFSGVNDGVVKPPAKRTGNPHLDHYGVFRVAVIDSGAGISDENMKKLFGKYVQFHANELQDGKGSGLGLWISKLIVEMHDGVMGAKSDGEGFGTTVFFELPFYETPRRPVVQSKREGGRFLRAATATDLQVVNLEANESITDSAAAIQMLEAEQEPRAMRSNSDHRNSSSMSINLHSVEGADSYYNSSRSITSVKLNTKSAPNNSISSPVSGNVAANNAAALVPKLDFIGDSRQSATANVGQSSSKYSLAVIGQLIQSELQGTANSTVRSSKRPILEPRSSVSAMQTFSSRKEDWSRSEASGSFSWRVGEGDDGDVQALDKSQLFSFLVVDDDTVARKLVGLLLRPLSRVIDYAENGAVAVSRVRDTIVAKTPYDVILIDYNMPQKNGPVAIRDIRAMQFTGLIIGLSAAGDEEMDKFKLAGADSVLTKPLKIEDLRTVLIERFHEL